MTRVYRQSYTAQHQFRPRFFATPDPVDGALDELLDNLTATADGTFTDVVPVATGMTHRPLPMPRLSNVGRIVSLKLTANLGRVTAQTSPRVELADEELIEIL